jgi:thiamine biosynthesis lipoprotein
MPRRPHTALCCLLLLFSFFRPAFATTCTSDGRYVMGTVLEITLCGEQAGQSQPTFDTLFAAAARLDALLTTSDPGSPVSRLNARAGHGPTLVPPEVADTLSFSLRYSWLTGGTFDVTVGPLLALWRQAATAQAPPTSAALRRARARVGGEKIHLFADGTVSLQRSGMAIDLGGIGKGYALDRLVETLRQQHTANALLSFGQSSIWALGTPPDAEGWRLLVQRPDGGITGTITLRDQALSVSGSLGQTFDVNGRRYGHVIDPRSGEPLRRDLLACVLAPTAAQAEALSKALLILGEQEGIALLQRIPGVEGMLCEAGGRYWMTRGWRRAAAFVPL